MKRDYKKISVWKDINEDKWNDWHWQFSNRITTLDELGQVIDLTPKECDGVKQSLNKLKMAITPYYAILIDKNDVNCPIRKQAVPSKKEMNISKCDSTGLTPKK